MKKLILVSLVLVGVLGAAVPASGATQYYVKEVMKDGRTVNWGDRAGQPMTQPAANQIAYKARSYHGSSTVTVEVYSAQTLKAFNLDR
jgi:hypothetical protein